jgi:mycothiol synthase
VNSGQIGIRERASDADERVSLEVHNAVWPSQAATLAEVRHFKSRVRDHADYVAVRGGAVVGSAVVAILPQRLDIAFVLITVLEEKRRLGAGMALYGAVSHWAAQRSLRRIWAPVEEDDSESFRHAERRGFVEIERSPRMVLDLGSVEEPQTVLPVGIEIVSWAQRPELARGIYDVAVEAYADIPGAEGDEMESFEDWLAHDLHGSADRPDATFVAVAGAEVIGYAKLSVTAARPTTAKHAMTGVRRGWRGRGIARALKCAQISWAMRSGFERLETSNEQRNTAMRTLNARLGYRTVPGRILMEGPRSGDYSRLGDRPLTRSMLAPGSSYGGFLAQASISAPGAVGLNVVEHDAAGAPRGAPGALSRHRRHT